MNIKVEKLKKKGSVVKNGSNISILKSDTEKSTMTLPKPAVVSVAKKMGQSKSYVIIDYPQNGEKINSANYTIRIGSSGDGSVQISINNGEWLSCRFDSGYYWFDWYSIPAGKHQCIARIQLPDGTYKKSQPITCSA